MLTAFCLIAATLFARRPLHASTRPEVPASRQTVGARPDDVGSFEAILAALYDVISGPAGQHRDWNRMRTCSRPVPGSFPPSIGLTASPACEFGMSSSTSRWSAPDSNPEDSSSERSRTAPNDMAELCTSSALTKVGGRSPIRLPLPEGSTAFSSGSTVVAGGSSRSTGKGSVPIIRSLPPT